MTAFDQLAKALAGRYALEREIGTGGMATVYLAEDLKLHRQVAVKVLRPELAATLGPSRFLQEIDIAAQLHHPHILALHDSGEAEGFLYYVMPYVEGESLRDKLAREAELPIPEAVRIIREVVDALSNAHARNVVHRDIKPDNVMVSGRHVLVMDFGIAKAVSEATGRRKMTTAGMALGTPSYMAPEQAAADPHVDHRADIYAVGAMAYEMLAGRPPFTGQTQHEILAAHLAQAPEPVTKFRPAVSPELAEFVARCLEKKPADRWQSADQMLSALDTISTPSGDITPTRGLEPMRGTRVWRRVGLGALMAVAALMGYRFVWEGRPGTLIGQEILAKNDLILVAEFQNRTDDSLLGATVTDAIRVELQQTPVVEVVGQQQMWDGIRRMGLQPGIEFPDTLNQQLALRENAKAFITGDVSRLGVGYQLTARVNATVDRHEVLTKRATAADAAGLIGAVEDLGRQLRTEIGESFLRWQICWQTLGDVTTPNGRKRHSP